MINLTSIQVVSNEPEGLHLQLNGQKVKIKSVDKASSAVPSLFILSTAAKPNKHMNLQLKNWVDVTNKFIEAYQQLESFRIMLTVQIVKISPGQAVDMVNDRLELGKSLQEMDISVVGEEDALWDLVLDASLRSDLSHFLVLEEALAACTPLEHQEVFEQDALRSLSIDAARSLDNIYSVAKETDAKLKTITKENDLLLNQLHNTQEELETIVLKGQEFEVWKASIEKERLTITNENAEKSKMFERENSLLTLQLHQVQEEFERYFIALKDIEDQQDKETIPEKLARIARSDRKSMIFNFRVLFDANYYRQQRGQKRLGRLRYKYKGWKRGIDPHPLFDTEFYLKQIGLSLSELRISPLMHYLRHGTRLNLSTHREFDTSWYKRKNPDVAASRIPLVVHFLAFGWREGRNPNPDFDCNWYLSQYPDVADAGMNPFVHFLLHGREEGRKPRA